MSIRAAGLSEIGISKEQLLREAFGCSKVTASLICQLLDRDAHGLDKYGTSLDRTDLSLVDWLQHQAEELMDGAGYALAAKREAERLQAVERAARAVLDDERFNAQTDALLALRAALHDHTATQAPDS